MRMQRRTIGAVVFDKDGVLADSEPINLRSARQVFADHGVRLDADADLEIVGRHPVDYLPRLADRFGIDPSVQRGMMAEKERLYRALWDAHGAMFAGARDTLEWLRSTELRIGIATSGTRAEVDEFLRRFDLARFFDVSLSRDDVSAAKPAPDIYLACSRRLGVPTAQMMVIEDSEFGIRSARAAGAFCVAVRSSLLPPERVAAADLHIDRISELPNLLAEVVSA